MTEPNDQASSPTPPKSSAPATEIKPGEESNLPDAVPPSVDPGCLRPYCNEELNSRVAGRLSSGVWKIKWRTDLDKGFQPSFVVQTGDRIITTGPYSWKLFDGQNGKPLAIDSLGAGPVVLDKDRDLFYHPNAAGLVLARQMSDGQMVFATGAYSGKQFRRAYLARRGNHMLILSVEYLGQPHGGTAPSFSIIQVQDLGDPPQPDANKLLTAARTLAELSWDTIFVTAGLHGESLVVAIPSHVFLTDLALHVRKDLKDEFEPVAMSLDEAGRIYLLARAGNRVSLWVLSAEGNRLTAFALPKDLQIGSTPPIVGYNHQVFIIGSDRVLAINPDGKLAWVRPVNGQGGGAVVTAGNELLISDGSDLVVFDPKGQRRVLHTFTGEVLNTPPVLTARGEILVASQERLYALDH